MIRLYSGKRGKEAREGNLAEGAEEVYNDPERRSLRSKGGEGCVHNH